MKWSLITMGAVLALAIGASLWVRMAPSDPSQWHAMPEAITDRDLPGGAMRVVGAGENGLARLDAIIRATPRTELLAGTKEEGLMTYVTRSALWGFPDYTTIRQRGKQIELYGRARYGRSDLGVNAARLDRWLGAFAQGG